MLATGERRRWAASHQRQARGAAKHDLRILRWTLEAYVSYARYYVDMLRSLSDRASLLARVDAVGHDAYLERAARGEGVIIALAHVGNWDLAGAWAHAVGAPVVAVAERLAEPEVTAFFDRLRDVLGIDVVEPGARGTRLLLRTLREGGRVALVVDRDVTGSGRLGTLFGREVPVAAGPAVLAVLADVPVLPAACYQLPGRRHLIRVWPPIEPPRQGSREERIAVVHRAVVAALEEQIALAPSQWHNLVPGL